MPDMPKKYTEVIKNKKEVLAIIIYKDYRQAPGISFFTPPDFPQQLAFMTRKKGEIIEAHSHNAITREISLTQEVLIVRKGELKVNFYDSKRRYLKSRILKGGDVILLAALGHGFEVIKPTEMIEVKQGPYLGKDDKTRFKGIEK